MENFIEILNKKLEKEDFFLSMLRIFMHSVTKSSNILLATSSSSDFVVRESDFFLVPFFFTYSKTT